MNILTKVQKIERDIELQLSSGKLSNGDQLPSLNSVKTKNHVSRDTVVRAYNNLVLRGILNAIPGKGFFVATNAPSIQRNVFLFLDELSDYKNSLVKSIEHHFGNKARLRIFFHHYDEEVFKNIIMQSIGNFTDYVVSPFPGSKVVTDALNTIPKDQLILLDRRDGQKKDFKYVGQEYELDIQSCLIQLTDNLQRYSSLNFIFPEPSNHPQELKIGFTKFCKKENIPFTIRNRIKNCIRIGEAYLVIDDTDLASIVENVRRHNLVLGKDVGLISYNETRLKGVIDKGITTISTDFYAMGRSLAELIFNPQKEQQVHNPARLVKRNSF